VPAVRHTSRLLSAPLRLGNLVVDEERLQVYIGERRVWLTYLEFRLLLELAARAGSVVTREELLDRVWGDAATPPRRLDVQISRLRANLRDLEGWAIATARKRGYALLPDAASASTSGAPTSVEA
jgi:DNA-binding response OmpR family regulator